MALNWIGKALPKEYHFTHEFLFALHDELVSFIHIMEQRSLRSVELRFRDEAQAAELQGLDGEQILEWMEKNGFEAQLGDLLFRTLFYAILGDSCHFLYEALRCSEKAKLTVTYTLLRKPIRDNLLYLEYLLADPEEFLNSFWSGTPNVISFESMRDRGVLRRIIADAVARTTHSETFDAQFLIELRYEKSIPFSLDAQWHKAIHLVTTTKHVATEPRNLNFVFSDDDSLLEQWDQLYSTLPYLLFYMTDVCTSLLVLAGAADAVSAEQVLRRAIGFILAGRDHSLPRAANSPAMLDVTDLELHCRVCGKPVASDWTSLRKLYEVGRVRCGRCRRYTRLSQFLRAAE